MREEELKSVIAFHTAVEAIAMETMYRKMEVPGRLIPVPRQISAGRGLSWSIPEGWRKGILEPMGA